MQDDGSVTHWFKALQDGNQQAAEPLWERYFERLEALTRKKFSGMRLGIAEPEDVALSAFHSLCRGLENGKFPKLQDRDNLWRLLVVIAARKSAHLMRDQQTLKRGGGLQPSADSTAQSAEIDRVIGSEPTPEFAAAAAEEYNRLLEILDDDELRQVAMLKMQGYTNREIAKQLDRGMSSVDRKLRLIKNLWQDYAGM